MNNRDLVKRMIPLVGAALWLSACANAPPTPQPPPAVSHEELPPPAPEASVAKVLGEYEHAGNRIIVAEYGGSLVLFSSWYLPSILQFDERSILRMPPRGQLAGREVSFTEEPIVILYIDHVPYRRLSVGPEAGGQLKITPVRPVPELIEEALRATPPVQPPGLRVPDLVELTTLDSTIHLDIRYATTNNFAGTVFYSQARAFLQRPAAEALLEAHRWLRQRGYGLLIHDGYRPWYVTRTFWDAVPDSVHWLVANPAQGSRHNRGSAVDLSLYDLSTGRPVEMPGTYDEATRRSFPTYPGGTTRQRWFRALLRTAMEAQGFSANPEEWWHFDYKDWRQYPVLNLRFEDLRP